MNSRLEAEKVQLELYANIVKNMQFGLIVWHLEDPQDVTSFRLVTSNPAASHLTGMSLENFIGQRITECFPHAYKENRDTLELYVEVAMWDRQIDRHETYCSNEHIFGKFFSIKVFPLPEQCIGIVFDDITQQKQAEQALLETDERFRATFKQAAVGIAHVAIDGRWLRVNQKLCEIVGYSHQELLEQKFQDITHPDDLEQDLNCIKQLLAGEIEQYSLEKRYIHKDGSIVWIDLTVSLAQEERTQGGDKGAASSISTVSPPEKSKYFIAVIEEINERKAAEMALLQRAEELTRVNTILAQTTAMLKKRNDELDQFAYVASHDLKAPLRAIANLSEWLEEDLGDSLPKENQQQMRLLRGRVRRMEALINGLLEYSRVGRTQAPLSMVNVASLIKEVVDSLCPPPTFVIDVELGMPIFVTKRLPLLQIFSNLIGNAIKHHSRTDGLVKISVEDRGAFYEFAVSDDGPGIAPEFYEKVFLIFQTLEARDQKESTGVGLAIVKKIVEAEGGTISLESQEVAGSTFRFTWLKKPLE
ncbi:PAS domain S-box protein [Scytonema sp. NUACC26]|uniref:PAS domain S-box protein n=1 Tax=Scytonema sp. NUACC26 TaxID=3140176 RepID=UPI0038B24A80